jgi:muramoyltetrapeptide carboxypeptidase
MRIVKPKKITKGDLIGIISPASSPEDASLISIGVNYLEKLGYQVEVGKSVGKSNGYLAGTDEERITDIHYMFKKKDVKAIFCVRGGYGASRLIDKLNYKIIKNNPKIFVGYSEITALQMALLTKAGLLTFAGPMLIPDFTTEQSAFAEEFFWRIVTSNKKIGRLKFLEDDKLPGITKGGASGRIVGGNLSVFAEDIGELPYKIDRFLNQLRLNNILKQIKGLILGRFVDCYEHDPEKKTLTLGEVIENYFHQSKIPIIYSFPHGHIKDKVTLPIGLNIKMNATKGFVEYSEGAVR